MKMVMIAIIMVSTLASTSIDVINVLHRRNLEWEECTRITPIMDQSEFCDPINTTYHWWE